MESSQYYVSFRLSVSMSVHPHRFLAIIRAAYNCVQSMLPQATVSNPLSGIIMCPPICLSVSSASPFSTFVFVLISSVGFHRCDTFIPSGVQLCLYVCLSVSLPGRSHRFLVIICAARNCAQCMRPQVTVSNPLNESMICTSVRSSVGLLRCLHFY